MNRPVQREMGSSSQGRKGLQETTPQPQSCLQNCSSLGFLRVSGDSRKTAVWGHWPVGGLLGDSSDLGDRGNCAAIYKHCDRGLGGEGGEVILGHVVGHLGDISNGQLRRGMRASGCF